MKQTPVPPAKPCKESKESSRSPSRADLPLGYEAIEPVDKGLPLSPLMRTIYNSNDRLFQELLKQGHSLEQRNYRGDTPLMVAIGHDHHPTIEAILQTKPDIQAKNVCGDTAINYALVFAGKDLARKIQPDLQDGDLDQLLAELDLSTRIQRFKEAAKKGDIATVEKMLTAKEIDINFIGPDDRPLWLAMEAFDLAMVQRLLAYGADPSLYFIGIIHTFDIAKSSKSKEIKSFFFALKKEWKRDPEKSKLLMQGILGDVPDTDEEEPPPPSAETPTPAVKPAVKGAKKADIKAVRRGERTGKGKAAKQPAIREMFAKGGADGCLRSALAGKTVVVSGNFENFHRLFLEVELQELGASIEAEVSKTTDLLIAGSEAGLSLKNALRYKLPIWTEGELFKRLELQPTQAKDALPSGGRLQEGRVLERGETPLPMPPGIAGRLSLQWSRVELPIHPAIAEMWGPSLALKTTSVGRLVYQGAPLKPTETEAEVFFYSRWTDDGMLLTHASEDLGGREGFFCAGLLAALKAKQPLLWEKTGGEGSLWRLEIRDRWDLGVFLGYEAETYQIDLHAKTLQWSHCWVSYHFAT